MKLTIEFTNGKYAQYTGKNAESVEHAIARAVNIGDQATNSIRLKDGKCIRLFINAINSTVIEF